MEILGMTGNIDDYGIISRVPVASKKENRAGDWAAKMECMHACTPHELKVRHNL